MSVYLMFRILHTAVFLSTINVVRITVLVSIYHSKAVACLKDLI